MIRLTAPDPLNGDQLADELGIEHWQVFLDGNEVVIDADLDEEAATLIVEGHVPT